MIARIRFTVLQQPVYVAGKSDKEFFFPFEKMIPFLTACALRMLQGALIKNGRSRMVVVLYCGQRDLAVPYPDPVPWAVLDFIELREDLPVRFPVKFYLFCGTFRTETQITGWVNEF